MSENEIQNIDRRTTPIPIGYIWEEEAVYPASSTSAEECDSELCFDVSPPIDGVNCEPVYPESELLKVRLRALEDVAVMATVGATYEELMRYIGEEISKCDDPQEHQTPVMETPKG